MRLLDPLAGGAIMSLLLLVYVYPCWRIAKRMGYPGAIGLLALVPGVNVLVAFVLAFHRWPVLRELEALRAASRAKAGRLR